MNLINQAINSPIQEIKDNLLQSKGLRLLIKRDDLIHPQVSGNKWRKLKYNLLAAKEQKKETLLTFGGAFSNHIYATAAAGKVFGFKTIGIIRGERVSSLNPTLSFAEKVEMHLHFISRSEYRQKDTPTFQRKLRAEFGDFYLVPEGGTNQLAIKGCTELVSEIKNQLEELPDYWCVACGTGGTITGIIKGLQAQKKVLGFSVLKGDFHQKEIQQLLEIQVSDTLKVPDTFQKNKLSDTLEISDNLPNNWQINTNYHFGGYAKFKPELIDFINEFKLRYEIQLDPVYTGKLLYGIFDLIQKDYFPEGSTILAIHTGGLQGIEGFNQRFDNLIKE